jgi:hypothetical protein
LVVICREGPEKVKAFGVVADWPSESCTVTLTMEADSAGVTARIWEEFINWTAEAATEPNCTEPAPKLEPKMVTVVPPLMEPEVGEMEEIVGAGGGVAETARARTMEVEADLASCTWALKEKEPAWVGVPEMMPVGALN